MIMDFFKTFFFAIFILMSFYVFYVKGKSVVELEDKNQTRFGSSETVDEGIVAANETDPCVPNPCKNGGFCLRLNTSYEDLYVNSSSEEFSCMCEDRYTGTHCEIDICSKCNKDEECLINRSGILCKTKGNITEPETECENLTCVNSGICIRLEKEECICPIGFKGERCEIIDKDEHTCIWYFRHCEETGGYCHTDEKHGFQCICPNGTQYYFRHGCFAEKDLKNCSLDMINCAKTGGYCSTNQYQEIQCKCPGNFKYEYNHGCVVVEEVVNCSRYMMNCEETGGYCTRGIYGGIQCKCPENSTYERNYGCRKVCFDGLCENGGRCIVEYGKFKCICKEPFAGKFCETDLCKGNFCKNGGICRVDRGVAKCFCKEPYIGKYCDNRLDACETNVCENLGVCRKFYGETVCFCLEPYGGRYCDVRKDITMITSFSVIGVIAVVISSFVTSAICCCCFRNRKTTESGKKWMKTVTKQEKIEKPKTEK